MALRGAVCKGLYDEVKFDLENAKAEIEKLKRENGGLKRNLKNQLESQELLKKEIQRMNEDCVEKCWLAEQKEENDKLKQQVHTLTKSNKQKTKIIRKLRAEVDEHKMKSNAKSDYIRNMFSRLIKDADIDDGFYIERDWGHKYIDKWNEIVSQEIQEAIKDINEDDEHYQIRTDGYQFDFHYPESESDDDEVEYKYTHGVAVITDDDENEDLFQSYEEALKDYEHNIRYCCSGRIVLYSVPEGYDGSCESFKDAWIIHDHKK